RIFTSRESAVRLLGAVLLEIDNKWAGGRKYLDMDEYYEYLSQQQSRTSPKIYCL
ncbi:MAG TPA: IS256 family transposase, partial [Thermovirga lienii]|nr:IS256 family transposase [Thermovirga lienii]